MPWKEWPDIKEDKRHVIFVHDVASLLPLNYLAEQTLDVT